ncbi:hypothetical protein [uncultured Aquimarina sp.]|uniref:hypothetical protein n=1 Tax=uncultured Aquimarina sp. TaxID=575652 RepID=UPI002626AC85|nr:hypothetical protein [uncultured Aquimarina sp.]
MKKLLYILLFALSLPIFGQRTIGKNTRFIGLDTIPSTTAITLDAEGRPSIVDLLSGSDNFQQYGQFGAFPNPGDEKVIYYAQNSNKFYVYTNNNYREVPFVNITNILKTSSDNDELITNGSVGKRFVVTQNGFLKVENLKTRGYSSPVDLTNSDYTLNDVITTEIQQGTTNVNYLLLRKSAFEYLDQPGKRIHISLFGSDVSPNLSSVPKGFLQFTTDHQNLTGLDPDFYCFINEGSIFANESQGLGAKTGFQNIIDVDLSTAGGGTDNQTLSITNDQLSISNGNTITIPSSGGSSNGNIIVANSLADINNAPEDSYIDIQSDIDMVADYVAVANQVWSFSTGSIDKKGFNLSGTNTTPIFNGDRPGIIGEGTIDGTWNSSPIIYATNFGLQGDGKEYETGSITTGTNVLTVTGANFTNDDIGNFIAIKGAATGFVDTSVGQKSLQTTIVAVNSPTEVIIADNVTRTVTDQLVWTGYDNFQQGKNAIYVRNQKSGKFIFTPGTYFKSEYTFNGALGLDDPVVGWYFGDGTDDISVEAYGATIASIPHNLRRTRMITYGNTHRFRWEGGILKQDRLMHNYSGEPLADSGDDFNIVMYGRTGAYATHIKDVSMIQTEGTLFSTAGDLQFTNYIKGDNVTNVQQRVTQMVYGDVDEITGIVTPDANSDFAYTELYLDVSTQQFENTRISKPERNGLRNYQFAGQASSGWSGLTDKWFRAYYYDVDGNYLYASDEQRFYQTYEFNDEVKFVRIKVNRPQDLTLIDVQVRAPLNGHHLTLTNVHLREAAAHGLSNMPSHFRMIGGSMKKIGLVLPAFASNTEDQHSTTQDQIFDGVVFENAFTGYLNWINTVGIKVINCTFYGTSDFEYTRTNYTRALSMDDSRDAMAHGNHIFNGSVQVDRNAQFFDNTGINGEIQIRANGADVYDNELHNFVVTNLDAPIADRALSFFRDNRMTHDRPWASYLFTDVNMNVGYENIHITLNDKTRLSNTFEQDTEYERIVIGENGLSKMWNASPIPTKDYGGYLKNFSIRGARQPRASRDYAASNVYWPITDYHTVYSEASMNLKYGLPKDRTINDLSIDGWLRIDADQFGDVLTANAPTLTFNRLQVTIPENEFDWTNTGAAIFRVNDKNVNLVFNGGFFDLQVASTEVGTYKKWIRFEQLGTTFFKDFTFKSASPKTINLNDAAFVNVGAITLVDCTCENITWIGRAGIDNVECNVSLGSGITNLSYDPTNNTVQSDTGSNAIITVATAFGNDGLLSGTDKAKINGIESNATADQTAIEIISGIDAELGSNSWQTSGSGLDTTQNLTLTDGDNTSPFFELQNTFSSDNYRLRGRVLNSIAYWDFQKVSDNSYGQMRMGLNQFNPYATDVADGGTNVLRWRNWYLSGTLFATGVDTGGDGSGILVNDGGTIPNNFETTPEPSEYNVNRIITNNDTWVHSSTSNASYTINDEATEGWQAGKELVFMNASTTSNVVTLIQGGSTDIRGSLTINAGETVTLRYIGGNVWMLK